MKPYLFAAMLVIVTAGGVGLASNATAVDDADEISAPIERTALVQIEVQDLTIAKDGTQRNHPMIRGAWVVFDRAGIDGILIHNDQLHACNRHHSWRKNTFQFHEKTPTPKLAVLNPMEPQARIVAVTRGYSYPLRC